MVCSLYQPFFSSRHFLSATSLVLFTLPFALHFFKYCFVLKRMVLLDYDCVSEKTWAHLHRKQTMSHLYNKAIVIESSKRYQYIVRGTFQNEHPSILNTFNQGTSLPVSDNKCGSQPPNNDHFYSRALFKLPSTCNTAEPFVFYCSGLQICSCSVPSKNAKFPSPSTNKTSQVKISFNAPKKINTARFQNQRHSRLLSVTSPLPREPVNQRLSNHNMFFRWFLWPWSV